MKRIRTAAAMLCVCLLSFSAVAQMPTGSIVGVVTDPTGAVIPGAKMTAREVQAGIDRTTTTTGQGYYEFLLLPPGTYEVAVEAKGFQRMVERGVVVNAGKVPRVDFKLQVGAIAQTVEVTGALPLIQSSQTSINKAVDLHSIKSLPLESRNFLNLALLTPGAVPGAPGTQVEAFSVAGMRSQSNNYTLDGISNNDPQVNGPLNLFHITDAVQEFTVETSIASPAVGRNSGAQVSIITKSGGNSLHGSLFYAGRNNALDAAPFFLNRAGQSKNPLHRHQYGGTAGGPIRRDKTFWFFSFEGFRLLVDQPITRRVPKLAERATVTDPISIKLLTFFPQPNAPGANNWTGTATSITNNDTYFWRLDHNLTDNQRLSGRWAWVHGHSLQVQTDPFHGLITNEPSQHSGVILYTYASARHVNELRLGFSRNHTLFLPQDVTLNPATIFTDASGNPLPGYIDTRVDPLNGGLPRITIGGGFAGMGAGTNMPQGRSTNEYEVIDDMTATAPFDWSRHTFRFGAYLRHDQSNRFLNGNYRGAVSFLDFAHFATGQPLTGSLRTGVGGTFRTWLRTLWSFYFVDTYKPRDNITINYGLRYELPGLFIERHNRGSNFVPGVGMMALGTNLRVDVDPNQLGRNALILTPVQVQLPRSGQKEADIKNFAPSLGIAWTPKIFPALFGSGKTVIRTGFRLGYDDIFNNIPVNMGLNFPPVLTTTLPSGTYTWGTALNQNRKLFASDPTVPGGSRGILSFNAWDYNAPTAYGMNYAFEIERQAGSNYSLGVSYVGSLGRKLGVFIDPNQPFVTPVDPTKPGQNLPNTRVFPFPQYAGIGEGAFISNSAYNGVVVTARRRAGRGYYFTASYTVGRALDNNSSFFGSDADSGSFADTRNRKADRGRSGFDLNQRFVADYVVELPFGPGRRFLQGRQGVVGQVVRGWDLAGITSLRTGFPFTLHARHAVDYSGFNQFADRPTWALGASNLATNMGDPDHAFDCTAISCTAFVPPGAGSIGNVGRDLFTGPGAVNFDFGVLKNFPFGEGRAVQFRAEFFNFFNHTNFDLPSHNINFSTVSGKPLTSSTVGTIGSAADPRLVQLSLRIDF